MDIEPEEYLSMLSIIDRLYAEQEEHFMECDTESKKNHIFNDFILARKWLERVYIEKKKNDADWMSRYCTLSKQIR